MSFKAQHHNKCYCNKEMKCCGGLANCLKSKPPITTTTTRTTGATTNSCNSISSKSKSETNKKFVKINRSSNNSNHTKAKHGLGHSNTANKDFSRRNSNATTITEFSQTPSKATTRTRSHQSATQSPSVKQIKSILTNSVPTSAAEQSLQTSNIAATSESPRHEFTEQRNNYERHKELVAMVTAQRKFLPVENCSSRTTAPPDIAHIDKRFYELQKFRLQNANDCFSVHRQIDLRLRPNNNVCITIKPSVVGNSVGDKEPPRIELTNNKSNNAKKLTPYAVRQKLMQLRQQAEAIAEMKPSRRVLMQKQQHIWDKSCALRFQETY